MNIEKGNLSHNSQTRVITLDVLRGIAIIVVVLSHVFIKLVDYSIFDPTTSSIWTLILLAPLIFLGKWKTFFLLISAAGHVFSLNKKIVQSVKMNQIFINDLIKGIIQLGIAYLYKLILLPSSTLSRFIFTGNWDISPSILGMGFSDTLEIIALSRIFITTIYLLLNKISFPTSKELQWLWHIGVLGFFMILTIFLTPLFQMLLLKLTGLTPYTICSSVGVDSGWDRLYRIILSWFFGYQEPIFPFISSAFAGAIFGLIFSQEFSSRRKFNNIVIFISIGFIIFGLILMIFSQDIVADLWSHLHASWLLFVNLGAQSLLVIGFINLIEFKSHNFQIIRRLRFFRRFGLLSLSIYCFELIDLFPRWIFTSIFEIDLIHGKSSNFLLLLCLIIVTISIWSVLLVIWEKIYFWGSIESWVYLIMCIILNKRPQKDPLKSHIILYNVNPKSLLHHSKEIS
jgi:hypothetical protein